MIRVKCYLDRSDDKIKRNWQVLNNVIYRDINTIDDFLTQFSIEK